jgi:hypothetical protein
MNKKVFVKLSELPMYYIIVNRLYRSAMSKFGESRNCVLSPDESSWLWTLLTAPEVVEFETLEEKDANTNRIETN